MIGNKRRFFLRYRGLIAGTIVGILVLVTTLIYMSKQQDKALTILTTKMQSEMQTFQESHVRAVNQLEAGISQDNKRRWEIIGIEKVIEDVNPRIAYERRYQYAGYIVDEAAKYPNLPSELLAAMGAHESRFYDDAESVVGARGIFQVMPRTARKEITPALGIPYDADAMYEPEYSARLGAWYLSDKIGSIDGDTIYAYTLALAEYNGGPFGRNCYKNWLLYKDTDLYNKWSRSELRAKVDSVTALGGLSKSAPPDIRASYLRYKSLWYAQSLLPETANYIPDILRRYARYVDIVQNAKHQQEDIPSTDSTSTLDIEVIQ